MKTVRTLVHAWLVLDFFGDARRSGGASSTLTTTIFTQSFLALVFAALLYPETPPVPFAAANLCLSTLLVATGALGDHDQRNRRRADQTLLGTAPVARRTVVLARSGHAAFYVCLVTIGMALPPAILLACLRNSPLQAVLYVVAACACSGLATGALATAIRGLTRCCGHARAALLAGTGKAVLLGGGVALFALGMQRLQRNVDALPIGRLGAELLPPYHAARLLYYPGEAWRLLPFLGGGVLLLLLATAIGEADAARPARPGGGGVLERLLRRLAGRGPRLGIAEFVATSMWRSPGFRARVLPLLGLPAGMVFLSLQGEGQPNAFVFQCVLLQLPAIYLPFLIAFLPRADQTGTGWVFALSPHLSRALVHDATWRALVTHVLVPVHVLALGLGCLSSNRPIAAAAASVFAFAVAVLAARPMLRTLTVVPFTQDRDGDAATDLGGLFTSALLLGALGALFGGYLPGSLQWPIALAGLALAVGALRRRPLGNTPLAEAAESTQVVPPTADATRRAKPRQPLPEASLGRELRAIVVLYAACCVLPALVGTVFAG